jgi:hypothetical protein
MHIMTNRHGERRNKKFAAFTLAGLLTFAGVGTAFAYWTISGTGSGSANTTSPSTVTVVQTSTSTITAAGGSAALSGNFNNPNSGKVYVTAVTASVNTFSSQVNTGLPACTQADFTITGTSNTPGDIPAGNGVGAWSGLTLNLNDAATNQDNCENLSSVAITYTSS